MTGLDIVPGEFEPFGSAPAVRAGKQCERKIKEEEKNRKMSLGGLRKCL